MSKRPGRNGNGNGGVARQVLQIEKRPSGVALVKMDLPGKRLNTFPREFAQDFTRVLSELERDADVRAVVFCSGKPDNFLVGADIGVLQSLQSTEDAAERARVGQKALMRLEGFSRPVVAAIHGSCLGGGLELALVCRARIASDDAKTKFGLPEVKLGLLPALGGTQRLPRLVGVAEALDLMLTGRTIDAHRALALGLVDELVPEPILLDAACRRALELATLMPQARRRRLHPVREFVLSRNPVGRKILFERARHDLSLEVRDHYPAPEKILEVVRTGLERGLERGLEAEARAFGELLMTPQAAQLMNVFVATREVKNDKAVSGSQARAVRKVGVIGAGLMGSAIAYVTTAIAERSVRIKDQDDVALARALRGIRELGDEGVERGRLSAVERDLAMARITTTTDYSGFKDADVVIEAVFEDLDLKRLIAENVEAEGGPEVIFASNSSSLPIARIAEAVEHPERVIGMHYFSPAQKMPLLEVVVTATTAPWVVATCVALGRQQGKMVIVVRDGVGFYTTRILAPYLNEAAWLVSDSVSVEAIDSALADWGFPLGPLALLDEIGIDVSARISTVMQEAFGERLAAPPGVVNLVHDQRFGAKNARGFYLYDREERRAKRSRQRSVDASVYKLLAVEPKNDRPRADIVQRCVLQMINEAARCFGDGVLQSARDGDIGAIFGLGFPAFRGGPFRYVDTLGALEVVRRLERFEKEVGPRFSPAPVLVDMARTGDSFYGEHRARPGLPRVTARSDRRANA
jgi:3-hydroxyacyl-CoA dehydrogenase/enoyl-CoA hydratase/3-hydroxybutyryl-CoA epimerase